MDENPFQYTIRSLFNQVSLRMSRLGKFVVITALVWFAFSTVYFAHRNSIILQLLGILLMFCFFAAVVVSIVCIFAEWRKSRWFSLLPFAVCVLSVVISVAIVRTIRQAIFLRSLPSYESVVRQMESGNIPVSTNLSPVPQAVPLARLAYAVLAQKATNGALTVEFLTEGGFPVKHSGYLYVSSGVIEPGSMEDSRWPFRHEERPKWFYFSD
jgi:FtsH-binding integral membrane protein